MRPAPKVATGPLRRFRKPHCGSIRIDETYVKIRGQWRYLYRAIDKPGNAIDFLLTAKRDADAAKRFFRKILKDEPLLSPATPAPHKNFMAVFETPSPPFKIFNILKVL